MKNYLSAILMVGFVISFSFSAEASMIQKGHGYELTPVKVNTFCMAIVKGDIDTVKKMIELGSDVNQRSEGMTPLMYAARYNRVDIMKVLIEKGAKVDTRDGKGYSALKYAKLSNAKEAIALLKKHS